MGSYTSSPKPLSSPALVTTAAAPIQNDDDSYGHSDEYMLAINRPATSYHRYNNTAANNVWPSFLAEMSRGRAVGSGRWGDMNQGLSNAIQNRVSVLYPDPNAPWSNGMVNPLIVPQLSVHSHLGNNPGGTYIRSWEGEISGPRCV